MIDPVELKALVEKATPGPWFVDPGTPGHIKSEWEGHRMCGDNRATPTVARFDIWSRFDCDMPTDWLKKHLEEEPHNAALIALAPTLARQVLALSEEVERQSSLFDAIAHGDDAHRSWLKKAIADHFAGLPVDVPQGRGNAERATAAEADAKALRERLGEIREIAVLMDRLGGLGYDNHARLKRIAALAAIQDGKEPQRRVVDGPACPTRGFRIVREENPTFIIEDDQP